jgi:hypothetical protein
MKTNLELDTKKFLLSSLGRMIQSYDYAYPNSRLDKDRAHVALCAIKAQIDVLQNFLNAMNEQKNTSSSD